MKTLRRLFLMLIFTMMVLPPVIRAQDGGSGSITLPNGSAVSYPPQPYYGELIDYPGTSSGDQSGKLLVAVSSTDDLEIPMPNGDSQSSSSTDDLEIPMPNGGSQSSSSTDDLEIPMPNGGSQSSSSTDDLEIPMPNGGSPSSSSTDDLEIPMPNGGSQSSSSTDDLEIPMPNGGSQPSPSTANPTAVPTPRPPTKLLSGFYKQVGQPQISSEGVCFDPSVGLGGSCAADEQGTNEVHDFHNCWSNDPNSPNNKPYDGLTPVCQSTDSESLYVGEPSQFYGRLAGSAYGHGSTERQMLQQGGVSIASYGVIVGTQIEVLSPTKFVVKYVHREQGGCTHVTSVNYELSGQSEAACQQVIEVPEEQQQQPISTPPPLPPMEEDAPYTVALPVMPTECTADNRPPEDFKDTKVNLDEAAGTLSINYGAGGYTAFQNFGSTFSYVDQRTTIFRLNFTVFGDKISFNWYKTDANGKACSVDGELRPVGAAVSTMNDSETGTNPVKDTPYMAEWKPVAAFCTAETLAALPNFTQATIKAGQDSFTIDYGTGSYPLTRQMGSDIYYYMVTGADGSTVMVSLNSHSAEKFALLYQYSDAAGQMCMANLDLTN